MSPTVQDALEIQALPEPLRRVLLGVVQLAVLGTWDGAIGIADSDQAADMDWRHVPECRTACCHGQLVIVAELLALPNPLDRR